MKRPLLMLLILLLPLHTTWAAVVYVRNLVEVPISTVSIMTVSDQALVSESSVPSPEKYDKSCCPGCHTFCHFAAAMPSHTLSLPPQLSPYLASVLTNATTYQSYIPDGPTRPKWPAAS